LKISQPDEDKYDPTNAYDEEDLENDSSPKSNQNGVNVDDEHSQNNNNDEDVDEELINHDVFNTDYQSNNEDED
jgi:hypothetical protein